MYHTILVPLDGSPFGEQALPVALSIARRAGARVLLARVHQPATLEGLLTVYASDGGESLRLSQAYLTGVHARLSAISTVPTHVKLLEGPVPDALNEYALGEGVDLVVLSTHGHGPLSRFWLGSTADELVRRLPMPLLLLRPGEGPAHLTREPAFHKILVPLDGSKRAEQILEPATTTGAFWGATYLLTRVIAPVGGHELPERERRRQEAHTYLDEVATRLCARGLHVRTEVLVHKHAATAILEAAHTEGADLIALATRGHGGLKRLVLGSVADKVLRAASTPVLLFRPLSAD